MSRQSHETGARRQHEEISQPARAVQYQFAVHVHQTKATGFWKGSLVNDLRPSTIRQEHQWQSTSCNPAEATASTARQWK